MSVRKNPSRTTKSTYVTRNSSQLSNKKQQIKECKVNLTRLKTTQELPKCTVKVVRFDVDKNCKQTGKNDDKQTGNIQNKQPSKKVQGKRNDFEESGTKLQLSVEKSAPILNLRSRKLVKYAESSLEVSRAEEKPNVQKVPVYKQHMEDEKVTKRKADQYEFDSDSEKYKKRKRRKLDNSSLGDYNVTVNKVVNKNRKVKKSKKITSVEKEFVKKQKKKTVTLKKQESKNCDTSLEQVVSKFFDAYKKKGATEKNVVISSLPDKNVNKEKSIKPTNPAQQKIIPNKDITHSKDNVKKSVSSPENFFPNENRGRPIDNDDDQYFGFATADSFKSPKIKILSDVQLAPRKEWNVSIASPRLFKDGKPDANSTMLNNVLTPWRFNEINIKRNPHFIMLKESSLPCINQDMVLDHTIVDKLNESSKVENKNLSPKANKKKIRKTKIQSKIDDYLGSNIENKENNEINLSLFDIDQLSPIKSRTRSSVRSNLVRKRILSEKNSNEIEPEVTSNQNSRQSISPKSSVPESKNKENTYFGFDSLDDYSDKENLPTKEKNDRPFRLSVNLNDKKYDRKKKVKFEKEGSVTGSDEESVISELSDVENENGEIKLFEDFNTTKELEEERALKKKKKKIYDENRPRKRKDIRSKEEEEEADKWAAAFNSMCEEIDQFPLEIE